MHILDFDLGGTFCAGYDLKEVAAMNVSGLSLTDGPMVFIIIFYTYICILIILFSKFFIFYYEFHLCYSDFSLVGSYNN